MFGYINANVKELSAEEKRDFQSFHCGLCQSLRKNGGVVTQALLNRDLTFLVVLLTDIYELHTEEKYFVCPVHPARKKRALMNAATKYAADMNVLLSYHNLLGDWQDDKNVTKGVMSAMVKRTHNRVSKRYPRQSIAVQTYLSRLNMLEAKREVNIDAVAGLTGELFGEIFAWKEDEWAEELRSLGFHLGKFVYLMDSYMGLDKDTRRNDYNPFESMARENTKDCETFSKLILTSLISECVKSVDRLELSKHEGIVRNVIDSGVWVKYGHLQHKKERAKLRAEKSAKKEKEKSAKKAKNAKDAVEEEE